MPIKVLIVDDSSFFQHRLKEILDSHPDLKVVGIAGNGAEAIEKAAKLSPDVITMDYEMPVMDGVTAVRQIMAENPTPILMFSSLTYEGARITLDALEAGAVDFLPKNFSEISSNSANLKKRLHDRLMAVSKSGASAAVTRPGSNGTALPETRHKPAVVQLQREAYAHTADTSRSPQQPPRQSLKGRVKLLLLGASTGGPVALADVLRNLPRNFPLPVLIVQHMPENFTGPFAERLDAMGGIRVKQAQDGDSLHPGCALLAPGGKQMMIDKRGQVRILQGDARLNYKPSLDITFGSAANYYGEKVLAVIMTGMGSDGCEGARLLKQKGAHVWSQDEASSVIYGMPMAVARAGLTDRVLGLQDIGRTLFEEF